MRPDAPEVLRLVLSRADEMKAEDTIPINLTGKTAIADFMVVTTGRSTRQVGAIADRMVDVMRTTCDRQVEEFAQIELQLAIAVWL